MPRLFKAILLIGALVAATYGVFAARALPRAEHPFFSQDDAVLVIAHQGGDFLWPSNTLYAFEKAVELGVDILELDVHASKDGELVVIHDDTLERTTNGTGLVKEQSLAELKRLNAGFNWSPERKGESFPYRGLNLQIPTLKEVFESFAETRITIEIKQKEPSITQELCDLIRQYKLEKQVLINSFHVAALKDFRSQCPEVASSTTSSEVRNAFILKSLFLGQLYRAPAEAFQVPETQGSLKIVTPKLVSVAQQKNMNLQVWTPNETADMQRLINMGVNGIITDRPDRLMKLLGRNVSIDLPEGVPE